MSGRNLKCQRWFLGINLLILGLFLNTEMSFAQNRLTPAKAPNNQQRNLAQQSTNPTSANALKTNSGVARLAGQGNVSANPAASTNLNNAASPATDQSTISNPDQQMSPELKAKLQEAVDKFNKSDIAGSLKILNEMSQTNPEIIPPRLILAQWFSQLKNRNAVRVSLEMATEESPNDPEAYLLLAEISLQQGELTAAELLFQKGEQVLSQYSASADRKKALTISLLRGKMNLMQLRKRWAGMQQMLANLIQIQGESPELCRLIALSFFHQNQDAQARDWFVRADSLSKGEGMPADGMMAQFYISRGDLAKAKESISAAQKAYPKSTDVLSLSIMMAINENDLDAAWNLVQKLYQEDSKSLNVLKTMGNVALFRSDFAQAQQAFQEVVRQSPIDSEAVNGLALALCEQNDPEKKKLALQYATSNVQKQDNNREFLATLGWTLLQAGETDKAKQILQQSAADGQLNAATAYYFAVLLAQNQQNDEAKKLIEAALASKAPFFKRQAAVNLLNQL